MIILLAGSSHTGKTLLAQALLEKYKYPYLSVDHLKMGLIRSGNTSLTPYDDEGLKDYLWPIVTEMIKTAVENSQNLIVEGCYIPFSWQSDFEDIYRSEIRYYCLVMSEDYIRNHYEDITRYEDAIEQRMTQAFSSKESFIDDNKRNLDMCRVYDCSYILIDHEYNLDKIVWKLQEEI